MTLVQLLSGAMLAGLMAATTATASDEWTMLMGDPGHSGRVASDAQPGSSDLALAWRFHVHATISASPVAAGKQLFVAAENGNLYAIDLAAKKLQWIFHARGGIASTPALAGGMVYFLDRDSRFHALDALSGAPVWSFQTQGEAVFAAHGMHGLPLAPEPVPDPWDLYLSSPLVHDGKVYFGSSDQRVYALDAQTGKLVWAFRTGGMVHSSPALSGPNIVVGSWDGAVYALDAASGSEQWRFQTETEQRHSIMFGIQGSPSADLDTVYVGSRDGYFYALDAASGKRRWRYDAHGSWIVGTAALDEAHVYFGTADSGLLLALDKHNGRELYRYDTKVWNFTSPLRAGDALIGASMKGEIVVLDASSGRPRWRYRTDASREDAYAIIARTDGKFDSARLYGKAPHQLHAALEHVKHLGAFLASPLWHDGQLIVADGNGEVLVFAQAGK